MIKFAPLRNLRAILEGFSAAHSGGEPAGALAGLLNELDGVHAMAAARRKALPVLTSRPASKRKLSRSLWAE